MTISLNTASGGMDAFQQMLNVIGNNIANENTTAYKSSTAEFSDILSQSLGQGSAPAGTSLVGQSVGAGTSASGTAASGIGGVNPMQVGLGVQVASIYNNFSQGSMEQTGNTNDLAISGNGFFVVSPDQANTSDFYTRAGDFSVDANGNLVTPNGYYLMGAQYPVSGTQSSFPYSGTYSIAGISGSVTLTNSLQAINLDQTNTTFSTGTDSGLEIQYTSSGSSTSETLTLGSSSGTGYSSITLVGGMLVTGTPSGSSTASPGMQGSVTEIIATPVSGTQQIIQIAPGSSITFTGTTTGAISSGDHTVATLTQGSFTVAPDGTLTVQGGLTYYLPMANFNNPSGLVKQGDNLYTAGYNSGAPVYMQADPNQGQTISQGFLEGSNVDLTKEMSNMIVAQTGYDANSKVISTVNGMLQFMVNNV